MVEDAAARARVGSVLNDKWTLEKLLGVGGMGAVYAARHTRNAARAAIKVLHPDLSRFEEVRERFLREGRAANMVQHPGVVKVIDDDQVTSGPDAGTAYLVMELLDGESLEDRIERGATVSEREFLEIADAVLGVLAAAHARGVVHRDLKPENLFFARDSAKGGARWMVLDFGLARLLDATVITRYGMAVGTPAYMSPEQAAGRRDEIDGRTDLFALAATGFRVLTGRRVHEASSPVAVVLKMGSVPAPLVREVAPKVSEGVARVIIRALAFKREDRYPDAGAMRVEVLRALAAMSSTSVAKTIIDVDAPTIVQAPGVQVPSSLPGSSPLAERTIELSDSDFEPMSRVESAPESSAPARSEPQRPPSRVRGERDPNLPPSRTSRPSFIPVITALFLGGLVVKLALDAAQSKQATSDTVAVEASAPIDRASSTARIAPSEPEDAEAERALARTNVEDAGGENDAQAGDEAGEAAPDARAESMDVVALDGGVADAGAVDAGPRAASAKRSPAREAPMGPARAMVPAPRRPPRLKPHPRHAAGGS